MLRLKSESRKWAPGTWDERVWADEGELVVFVECSNCGGRGDAPGDWGECEWCHGYGRLRVYKKEGI
jgi:hypothetical protein